MSASFFRKIMDNSKRSNSHLHSVTKFIRLPESKRSNSPLCLDILKTIMPKHKGSNSPLCLANNLLKIPKSKRSNSHLHSVTKFIRLPESKRSQSQIIATILLILISIAVIGIIANFSLDFVRDEISESDCFDVIDEVKIRNNPDYTCYDVSNNMLRVQIYFNNNESLEGFVLEVGAASSKTFYAKKDSFDSEFTMYDGGALQLPGKYEERVYNVSSTFSNPPERLSVHPIIKEGKVCESSDKLNNL